MNRSHRMAVLIAIAFVVTFGMQTVIACPSCYGAADSPMTEGMNMAILSLLGITGGVLVSFVAFFVYLRRRARMLHRMFTQRLN